MKRQPPEWEKIFANNISDKKNSYKSISTKQTNLSSGSFSEDLNRHFSKEDKKMARGYMKRCSTSVIIRVIQIKTTMRSSRLGAVETNRTRNHEVVGLIPGLAQQVRDPALP